MRFIFMILLIVTFVFSLALVIMNTVTVQVNLVFTQVPAMPLGLLIVITLFLGLLVGLLLGIQIFRVFQTRWELSRLKKELDVVRAKHIKAVEAAANAGTQSTTAIAADQSHQSTSV